jgi:hypothetical protein
MMTEKQTMADKLKFAGVPLMQTDAMPPSELQSFAIYIQTNDVVFAYASDAAQREYYVLKGNVAPAKHERPYIVLRFDNMYQLRTISTLAQLIEAQHGMLSDEQLSGLQDHWNRATTEGVT